MGTFDLERRRTFLLVKVVVLLIAAFFFLSSLYQLQVANSTVGYEVGAYGLPGCPAGVKINGVCFASTLEDTTLGAAFTFVVLLLDIYEYRLRSQSSIELSSR